MPGENVGIALPAVESGQVYSPASLAWRIENLQLADEGSLQSVRGPAPLIPNYGAGYPYGGKVFGVFHALLDGGMRDVTLIRAADRLYVQRGWNRNLETLATGLSADPNAKFPDLFVEVAGKVIWSNGIDSSIIYDGYTSKVLGFAMSPNSPNALGPSSGDRGDFIFRNKQGYSHPGKMGLVGDYFTDTPGSGVMLDSNWTYHVQFEDVFGDRSPMSPAIAQFVRQERTATSVWTNLDLYPTSLVGVKYDAGAYSVTLDDLTRQLCLTSLPTGPRGTVARLLYRTNANELEPRFLARIPDNVTAAWPDNTPDSSLGAVASDYMLTPRFQIGCSYQGRLAIVVGNRVRLSDPGFPGSFREDLYIDIEGSEPTGLASFGGYLYAFTEQTVFRIEYDAEGLRKRPVLDGVGAVSPAAIVSTDLGVLVWLGRKTWYSMTLDEKITDIGGDEMPLFKRLNPVDLSRATAVWNPNTREYVCAVPEAGATGNQLVMAWDGRGWRRQRYGITFSNLCVTKDWRRYVLAAGQRLSNNEHNVWVMDREVYGYEPPTKTYKYKSNWIRRDPTGRLRFNVDTIYVGIIEASNLPVTWRLWRDGSRDTEVASGTLTLYDPDTPTTIGTVVIGTSKYRTPRLTWFKFDARLIDVQSFAFDLECSEPAHINLAGFSFDSLTVDPTGARVNR